VPLVLQVVQSLGAGRAEATPLHKTFTLSEVYAQADWRGSIRGTGFGKEKMENGNSKHENRNSKFGNSCKCCRIWGCSRFWVEVVTECREERRQQGCRTPKTGTIYRAPTLR